MSKIKKILPKVKKSLKDFLTDESGKITKKDALWITAWALAFSALWDVANAWWGHHSWADHTSGAWTHASVVSGAHQSGYTLGAHQSGYAVWAYDAGFKTATCNHGSGIVNGHYSNTPTANISWHANGTLLGAHQSGYATSGHASWHPVSGHGSHSSY